MATNGAGYDPLASLNEMFRNGEEAARLREENAALRRQLDKQREKIVELEARCSRLAKLHAQAGQ